MPSYPTRNEPVKKKEQLSKRKAELEHAIRNSFAVDKLNSTAEKYRLAQLSLLKAKLHEFQERQFQKKSMLIDLESLEKKIYTWDNKPVEEIIKEFETKI